MDMFLSRLPNNEVKRGFLAMVANNYLKRTAHRFASNQTGGVVAAAWTIKDQFRQC